MTDQLPVLSRPRQGAMIAGVCAGLGRRLGVEPKVLRIIAVVSAIAFGGLGVALYVAGVLLLPRDTEQLSPLDRALPFTRQWPRWLVVATVIALLVAINWGSGAGPVIVPLTVIGVVIWAATRKHGRVAVAAPEPTPFERAADAWRVRLAEQHVPGFELPGAPPSGLDPSTGQPVWQQPYTDPSDRLVSDTAAAVPVPVPTRRRRSWRLWGLGLALIGAFTLAVAILSTVAGLPGTPVAYASAVLAALGLTLLIATRRGRPPLLVPATLVTGLVLAGLLAGSQVSDPSQLSELNARYTSADQLPSRIDRVAGDVNLDLSGLELTGSRELVVDVRAGEVRITVPRSVASSVDWNVAAGDVRLNGLGQDGSGISQRGGISTEPGTSTGSLKITVNLGLGDLEVNQ